MIHRSKLFYTLICAVLLLLLSFFSGIALERKRSFSQETNLTTHSIPQVNVVPQTLKINAEYIRCMATNIYHEAGSEPFMGQVMVARVVMNRIQHGFARNPCAVIYAQHDVPHPDNPTETRRVCQFSWVCEGKDTPQRNETYKQAEDIARRVLTENAWNDIVPNDVLFFHNTSVNPRWAYERVATIGNHIFYAKKREK